MGAGLKKDLRVSRVGPGGSLNAFFFLLIGVISQGLAMVRKKGGEQHTWRAQYNGELYAAFGKDESLPKRNLLILLPIGWTVGAMIYFTGEGSLIWDPWGRGIKLALANSLMHYLPSTFERNAAKGNKIHGPTPSSPPRRNYRDHPKDAFGIQGSRTDHRTLFNKWNALAVRSQHLRIGIALTLRARFKRGKAYGGYLGTQKTRKGRRLATKCFGELKISVIRRFPIGQSFRTAAESMGRQETTWRN
ncbi:ATP synthase subunit beta, chloroplastic-like [Quillaja saponaria]|uniref:ATP synthase subunit beta, chloroplastic-like n=1 Tax=Quillaja saponaria TaxID=32244 RepID=A0AAD7P4J2_QUISA|nr:ATP synthase subunit beta, chloroplastic-like [Quillaja saponaria]